MSGFDYKDEQGKSYRDVSSKEDCAPMVYPRCKHGGGNFDDPRAPDGKCVVADDCVGVCPLEEVPCPNGQGVCMEEGEGLRSVVLGVCTCANIRPVDTVCG